jgi:MOSC domain-containing protein YiiM
VDRHHAGGARARQRGEVVALWVKPGHGEPMQAATVVQLLPGAGIVGNANQGGRRQVTVIDEAAWKDACSAVGARIDPRRRRANVMVRGLDLAETSGSVLVLGRCRILVHGETRPCHQMTAVRPGLAEALSVAWRGGVYGEVLEGGALGVGDAVQLRPPEGPTAGEGATGPSSRPPG